MRKKISLGGMSCGHCAGRIREALGDLEGVRSVEVDLALKTAAIEAEADVMDEYIRLAIEDAGYEVLGIEVV